MSLDKADKVESLETPLEMDINVILRQFAEEHGAEYDPIQEIEFKELPRTIKFKDHIGTDFEVLFHLAHKIDLLISKAKPEEISKCTFHWPAEDKRGYIAGCHAYMMYESSKPVETNLPCKCGGTFMPRANKATGIRFYGCNRWSSGCKETLDFFQLPTEFTKKYRAKEVGRDCPTCAKLGKKSGLVVRLAKHGKLAGKEFVGCSNFPDCKYTETL